MDEKDELVRAALDWYRERTREDLNNAYKHDSEYAVVSRLRYATRKLKQACKAMLETIGEDK